MGRREELLQRLQELESMKSQQGSFPPGTTAKFGNFNVPINRKFTGDEQSAIAARDVFVPTAREMQKLTKEGVFESSFGNLGRTYRQWASSQPNAIFTFYDDKLQRMQGKYNSIKRYVFGEGGKQLTPFEASVVMALINSTGKSDEQYDTDLNEAMKIIEAKSRLAIGGSSALKGFGGV